MLDDVCIYMDFFSAATAVVFFFRSAKHWCRNKNMFKPKMEYIQADKPQPNWIELKSDFIIIRKRKTPEKNYEENTDAAVVAAAVSIWKQHYMKIKIVLF